MGRGTRMTEREWHRREAAHLFNDVWRLLEKRRRTPAEVDAMIHEAHASRYHWSKVGAPVNLAIGEWQISHVYAVLGRAEPSAFHAERCLAICRTNRIGGFALAFAYEALARAAAKAGRKQDRDRYLRLARSAGDRIKEDEDRERFFADLTTIRGGRRPRARA